MKKNTRTGLLSLKKVGKAAGSGMTRSRQKGQRYDLLMQAEQYWMAMYHFRRDRERNKRYLYGQQWSDIITYKGKRMTEAEYIAQQGNVPLTNNLIRRLTRHVVGTLRNESTEMTCVARDRNEQNIGQALSTLLQYNMQLNDTEELRAREAEEYCMSGVVAEREYCAWEDDKLDCRTAIVPPNNLILDCNMRDPRGNDCMFVGELHDLSFEQVCGEFARNNADYQTLQQIYTYARNKEMFCTRWSEFGFPVSDVKDFDFFLTADNGRCRVVEIWRKELKPRYRCHDWNTGEVFKIELKDAEEIVETENRNRLAMARAAGMAEEDVPLIEYEWFMDARWMYYFLSPYGDILDSGETPYEHKSHPYVFKAYPFIDGEIHSFVGDVIDQQRFINRLIIMNDMAIRSAAKGLMMIPIEAIPEGMNPQTFAEECTTYNGILFYKSKGLTHTPSVITSNSTNIGTTELLRLQMSLMEDISGVHGASQGKEAASGVSGTLYAQQAQNAAVSLVDLLKSFHSFERDAAVKTVKNIQQFYDNRKIENIVGTNVNIAVNPDKIRNLEFDIAITQSQSTPVYRDAANQFLTTLWQSGQIDIEQLLEHGDFPFADELLQDIRAKQQNAAQAQAQQAAAGQGQGQQGQASQQAMQQQAAALQGQQQQ
ncbi:MAG: hypothetical protein LUC22_02730 [Prevotella sp.]|nr:hypothetical protein [Prevotella sp.]